MSRLVALIDGEHYPPVVRSALASLAAEHEVAAAVFVGGTEKVDPEAAASYGVPVVARTTVADAILEAIRAYAPDALVDLSDEPVVSAADRFSLASLALSCGVGYRGADFVFEPPRALVTTRTPTLGIIGTGKRVGKTAISAYVARDLKRLGTDVVVLAMGRGGPAEPEIIYGDRIALTTSDLLAVAREGKHAASDNYEDAVMSRVTTVGCRRCGGGLAGETYFSNVPQGAELADSLGKELILLEGSGSAIPPVHADATILVVAAGRGAGYISDYFGPYRLARADVVALAFAEEPMATAGDVQQLREAIGRLRPGIPVVATTFRPRPIEPIADKRVIFATTAPPQVADRLAEHLAEDSECEVVAVTTQLSNRAALREDLARHVGSADVIVAELKAAAIDVAAAAGEVAGIPTVLCDNVPVALDDSDLSEIVSQAAALAAERAIERGTDDRTGAGS